MPELVLNPGQWLTIQTSLTTNAPVGAGAATSDFLTGANGTFLSRALPAGASLTSDCDPSCGPQAWITVPEPDSLALLACAASGLAALRRRSAPDA